MKKTILTTSIIFLLPILTEAQCFEDRHNGNWFDAWVSCTPAMNPNPARGEGHWIFYDLHHTYSLGESKIWNINDPDNTDRGFDQVAIDYSVDGTTWTELGIFNFPEAPGVSIYEGFDGPDFGSVFAKYVVITAGSNHGANCYGLSEIRIQVEDVIISDIPEIEENECLTVNVYPNPSQDDFTSKIMSQCPEDITWELYDAQGKLVKKGKIKNKVEENYLELNTSRYPSGLYHLVVTQGTARTRMPLVKLQN